MITETDQVLVFYKMEHTELFFQWFFFFLEILNQLREK